MNSYNRDINILEIADGLSDEEFDLLDSETESENDSVTESIGADKEQPLENLEESMQMMDHILSDISCGGKKVYRFADKVNLKVERCTFSGPVTFIFHEAAIVTFEENTFHGRVIVKHYGTISTNFKNTNFKGPFYVLPTEMALAPIKKYLERKCNTKFSVISWGHILSTFSIGLCILFVILMFFMFVVVDFSPTRLYKLDDCKNA